VFNLDQCDGIEDPASPIDEPEATFEPIERAQTIADRMPGRPSVKHGGDRGFYSPFLDYVQKPHEVQVETSEHYYGTLFHELIHATAHESRLDRKNAVGNNFGDESYSREELIAEMGAAYLGGQAGIEPNVPHHAAYIASWLKALQNDRKMLVVAAGAAQKAANYILGD